LQVLNAGSAVTGQGDDTFMQAWPIWIPPIQHFVAWQQHRNKLFITSQKNIVLFKGKHLALFLTLHFITVCSFE